MSTFFKVVLIISHFATRVKEQSDNFKINIDKLSFEEEGKTLKQEFVRKAECDNRRSFRRKLNPVVTFITSAKIEKSGLVRHV